MSTAPAVVHGRADGQPDTAAAQRPVVLPLLFDKSAASSGNKYLRRHTDNTVTSMIAICGSSARHAPAMHPRHATSLMQPQCCCARVYVPRRMR